MATDICKRCNMPLIRGRLRIWCPNCDGVTAYGDRIMRDCQFADDGDDRCRDCEEACAEHIDDVRRSS